MERMIPIRVVGLVIVMTDHAGGINSIAPLCAIDNGGFYRIPQGQALRVGLSSHVIVMAQGAFIASRTAMQFVDIILGQQGA